MSTRTEERHTERQTTSERPVGTLVVGASKYAEQVGTGIAVRWEAFVWTRLVSRISDCA